jgi:hypothetical protein
MCLPVLRVSTCTSTFSGHVGMLITQWMRELPMSDGCVFASCAGFGAERAMSVASFNVGGMHNEPYFGHVRSLCMSQTPRRGFDGVTNEVPRCKWSVILPVRVCTQLRGALQLVRCARTSHVCLQAPEGAMSGGMMDDVDDFIPANFHAELKSTASPLSPNSPLSANSAPAPQSSWSPHFGSHGMAMAYADAAGMPPTHAPAHSAPHAFGVHQSAHTPSQSAPGCMPPMHPGRCYSHDAYGADMSRSMHNGFAQTSSHAPMAPCSPNSASQHAQQRHSASYAEVRTVL